MSRRGLILGAAVVAAVLAGLVALVAPRVMAALAPPQVRALELENGTRVRLVALPSATRTALVLVFGAGDDDDPEGQSGRAHLAEHLLVTAAAGATPARSAEQLVAAYPDGWNAQTAARGTIVATVFAPARLDAELAEAAARSSSLAPTDADLARELPRVLAELGNMYGAMPALAAGNGARLAVRRRAGRGGRAGGVPEELARLTLDDLRRTLAEAYGPPNLVVAIAGPLDLDAAEGLVRARLGALVRGAPRAARSEAGQNAATPAPLRVAVQDAGVETAGSEPAAGPAPVLLPGPGPFVSCAAIPAPAFDSPDIGPFVILAARAMRSQGAPGGPPSRWAPLDEPELLYVCAPGRAETAVARLEALAAEPLARDEARQTRELLALPLGTARLLESAVAAVPYAVALAEARRAQLGLVPADLARSLDALTAASFAESAARLTAPARRGIATAGGAAPGR